MQFDMITNQEPLKYKRANQYPPYKVSWWHQYLENLIYSAAETRSLWKWNEEPPDTQLEPWRLGARDLLPASNLEDPDM